MCFFPIIYIFVQKNSYFATSYGPREKCAGKFSADPHGCRPYSGTWCFTYMFSAQHLLVVGISIKGDRGTNVFYSESVLSKTSQNRSKYDSSLLLPSGDVVTNNVVNKASTNLVTNPCSLSLSERSTGKFLLQAYLYTVQPISFTGGRI